MRFVLKLIVKLYNILDSYFCFQIDHGVAIRIITVVFYFVAFNMIFGILISI